MIFFHYFHQNSQPMQNWVNFHSHTYYCDGTDKPVRYVEEAIKNNLPSYGFSSHAPVCFPTDWCIPDDDFESYLTEIKNIKNAYKDEIDIYLGLEIDYIPGIAGRSKHLLQNVPLDYFIGSIHFVDAFADHSPWNIDTSFELFEKGLKEIFNYDIRKAATKFYELTRQMIMEDQPDVIGHLDKIKMFNDRGHFFNESEKWYNEQVEMTINTLKEYNTIVEINTRGFYRYRQADLYPGEQIIKKLATAEVPLMINSDAHKPEEIIMGMPYAAEKLMSSGVNKIYALSSGKWKAFSFNRKGIFW